MGRPGTIHYMHRVTQINLRESDIVSLFINLSYINLVSVDSPNYIET